MRLTDTHCHLNDPRIAERADALLARAAAAGVEAVVVPGWDRDSSARALALAEAHPAIHPAIGLHPWFVTDGDDLRWLPAMLAHPRVVAVGEIGLDGAVAQPHPRQEAVFRAQLALAADRGLPVLLHCRRRWDRLLACVRDTRARGVAHAFSGSLEILDALCRQGLYISFAGMVTRPNSKRARAAAAVAPADRLLLETDAPNMALDGIPAAGAQPAHLPLVLACVAKLRGEDAGELAAQIERNARALFICQ